MLSFNWDPSSEHSDNELTTSAWHFSGFLFSLYFWTFTTLHCLVECCRHTGLIKNNKQSVLGNSSTTLDEHDCLENEQLNPPRISHEAPPRGLRERRRRGSPLVTKLLWPGLHMTNIHTSRGTSFCAHILGSFDRTAQNMFLAGVPYMYVSHGWIILKDVLCLF